MKEQTINGNPVLISRVGNKYLIYYEGELIWLDKYPPTDQDLEVVKQFYNIPRSSHN